MSDLSKFGVPLNGQKLGILQPKLKFRFRVLFRNFGQGLLLREMTQNIMSVGRPKFGQDPIEVHSYNSIGYIAGKHKWEEITIKLRDDITNAVDSAIGSQVQKQINHFEQTAAVAGINYKFNIEIHTLDGTNNEELEKWLLDGCFISSVTYPEGDYSTGTEFNQIEMSVRYDNATHLAGPNTNGGTTVGGDPFPNISSPIGGITFG